MYDEDIYLGTSPVLRRRGERLGSGSAWLRVRSGPFVPSLHSVTGSKKEPSFRSFVRQPALQNNGQLTVDSWYFFKTIHYPLSTIN